MPGLGDDESGDDKRRVRHGNTGAHANGAGSLLTLGVRLTLRTREKRTRQKGTRGKNHKMPGDARNASHTSRITCEVQDKGWISMRGDIISAVMREVGQHFGLTPSELRSSRRSRQVLTARRAAVYLAGTLSPLTHAEIGRRFGGLDRTTVTLYCRAMARHVQENQEFGKTVHALKLRITHSR